MILKKFEYIIDFTEYDKRTFNDRIPNQVSFSSFAEIADFNGLDFKAQSG